VALLLLLFLLELRLSHLDAWGGSRQGEFLRKKEILGVAISYFLHFSGPAHPGYIFKKNYFHRGYYTTLHPKKLKGLGGTIFANPKAIDAERKHSFKM
jgi:hypothetical protein